MKTQRQKKRSVRDQGSALLVGLMVTVGLSLLGLSFVAISETESAIAINERNAKQAQDIAEAGATVVVEWYQSPAWVTSAGLMPAAANTNFKVDRYLATAGAPVNVGKYKPVGASPPADVYWCCDRPFKPGTSDRLWGTEASPDIIIDRSTAAGRTFLDSFNSTLFGSANAAQSTALITDIRIYAPPMINGRVNANGFYDTVSVTGTGAPLRYGLATIRVTAAKTVNGAQVAQRSVKIVISEYPFPGPQGPVQSNASISTGGNMVVHWGKMTSQGGMYVKRPLVGLPWFDAYTRLPINQGYDSCRVWKTGDRYEVGEIVCPTSTKLAAQAAGSTLPRFGYEVTTAGTGGAVEPAFESNVTLNGVFTDAASIAYRVRTRPVSTVDPYSSIFASQYSWVYEVLNRDIEDPWIEVRSFGAITNSVLASSTPNRTGYYQPFKYNSLAQDILADPDVGWSNWFELQTQNLPREQQMVIFPRIDYDFWKQVALTGRGTEGVYYLEWVAGDQFTDGGTTKTFRQWTDVTNGAQAGFYFFDTMNKQSPQVAGANNMTPEIRIQGGTWAMSGFIYLNAESFKTTGVRGVDGYYAFPGEPFQDIGVYDVDGSGNWTWTGSNYQVATVGGVPTAGNGKWDYLDLNNDNEFDVFVALVNRARPSAAGVSAPFYMPVPYKPGCTPGSNGDAGANCSEPHEPYLNIVYPADACCGPASSPNPVTLGWENPAGTITRRPKAYRTDNTLPSMNGSGLCSTAADYPLCTSNGYDRDGAYDNWSGTQDAPVLNGVLFNQGTFTSTGNARMYGSVLINGDVDPTGTNEVWFDERLIKQAWPPKEWPFPRAIITAIETDTQ